MITILKEPTGIYPVYNDSYIEFTSDLPDNFRATISLVEITENTLLNKDFSIYPNKAGKYLFNFKSIMKALINKNGFEDKFSETPTNYPIFGFGESINQGYKSQKFNIKVYNNDESEILPVTYTFYRSLKQIGESIYPNTRQILNRSKNGFDYNLTYFEGYPFAFDMQRVNVGTELNIENLNNGITSQLLNASSTNTFRIYVDTGTYNWTTEDFLPITDTVNRFQIFTSVEGPSVSTINLNLKKVPSKCGVYLKWFNHDGGYSYHLFDEFTTNTLTTKDLSSIATNKFLNVNEGLESPTVLIGKTGKKSMKVSTLIDRNEAIIMESLFTSPSIQMWSSQSPFSFGKWTNINISNTYKINTKKDINKVGLTIELPELLTPTL